MPVTYWNHGGPHQVSVVLCRPILGRRLAHLSQDGPDAWALRDYISGLMLRQPGSPAEGAASCTLAEIEALVTYSEQPLEVSVDEVARWKRYLRSRTKELLGAELDDTAPNPKFGRWGAIR